MAALPPLRPKVAGAINKIEKVRVLVDEIRAELDAGNLSPIQAEVTLYRLDHPDETTRNLCGRFQGFSFCPRNLDTCFRQTVALRHWNRGLLVAGSPICAQQTSGVGRRRCRHGRENSDA
jgi:hypothetical protein